MASIGGLLSGLQKNTLFQIAEYQVAGTLLGGVLAPEADALSQTVYSANPVAVLSPADAADAVLRNVWDQGRGAAEAVRSGVNAERFDVLARLAGNAPDPTSLAIALRRKLIDQGRYLTGIRQGRLRDEWAELIQQLAVVQPSPQAMLDAYLEGQISEAEARTRYAELGGDPGYFDILFHTQGQAPSPVQAADMANRGIIPWGGQGPDATSFEQAFLEGPWRNKWAEAFRRAAAYFPPPRTITAMYREGSLSRDQAIHYLKAQGLDDTLAGAYLQSGSAQKTAHTKDLARDTVTTLYHDQLITRAAAAGFLEAIGYDAQESELLLEVVDVQVVQRYLAAAVGRIHTLYVGHKITRADALAVLAQLQVPTDNLDNLVGVWDLERAANVKLLTASEVAAAYKASLIDQATAQLMLEQQGYQPHDAWLYLSLHLKAAQPNEPAATAVSPGPTPAGG